MLEHKSLQLRYDKMIPRRLLNFEILVWICTLATQLPKGYLGLLQNCVLEHSRLETCVITSSPP
jgi:hypothetical protein